jgi:hypothetical protein
MFHDAGALSPSLLRIAFTAAAAHKAKSPIASHLIVIVIRP